MKVKTDNPNYVKDLSVVLFLLMIDTLNNPQKKLSESQQINNIRSEMNDLKKSRFDIITSTRYERV